MGVVFFCSFSIYSVGDVVKVVWVGDIEIEE